MPNAENAQLQYESGQTPVAMVELTDQGDHLEFLSAANLWSRRTGYLPDIKPNGLATGGLVTPAVSTTDDLVDVAALTCYLAGIETDVLIATDETIGRATPTDTHLISSVTVTSAGAIAIVAGTDYTEFSEVRDGDGGPPLIPVGSIELAQVRLSASASAAITADEIFMVPNVHREMFNFPAWTTIYGQVVNGVIGCAGLKLVSALPLIHTAAVGKKVYASYYTPSFAEVPDASEFVPPANTHSVTSKQVYGRTIGSSSASLGQGAFSAELQDGITDALLTFQDADLWFKFKQNRSNTPYILAQGKLGVGSSFPAGDSIVATCTISAMYEAMRITS